MKRGATSLLTALFCTSLLTLLSPEAAAGPAWKKLHGKHQKTSRKGLVRQLKRDGVRVPDKLLKHKYLLRLEIRNAGGGSAKHSEVVVRFRSRPARAYAKAWSPGGRQLTAAQLGAWQRCKTKRNNVGRSCPIKYNGRGFRDVTSAFTGRNVLFVHDPKRRGAGNTILYFAAKRSQQFLWYYVVPKAGWPSFGKPRVRVKKFLVPKAAPPARLPGDPPDPGNPLVRPRPPVDPPAKVRRRPVNRWTTATSLHQVMSKARLTRRMRADGVAHPAYLLKHRFLLRVALTKAGGGSRSRSELILRLKSRPKKALGKAWSDRREMRRAQIGGANRCRPLPQRQGGPKGHRCPVHFNNLGWRNLISAFSSTKMRIITDPNNPRKGNVVLWLAFDDSQSGLSHKFVLPTSLPTFGKGKLALGFYAVSDGSAAVPTPRPGPGPSAGWKSLGTSSHSAASRVTLAARMRRDGVRAPAFLLKHKYLVRLALTGAGGGRGYRSEVVVRMSSRPLAALGTAWGDHRRRYGAQLGSRASCRALPKARNPYGATRTLQWHACSMQYNGLGWRNLISAFKSTEMMFITAPLRRAGGNQVLWLAYDKPQSLSYQAAVNDQAHRFSLGRVHAEKFVHGAAGGATPPAGGGHAWKNLSGSHRYLHRNQLYWAIRKDGFNNPWYLLKKRYLVRVQITATRSRSHMVLRFPNAPGMAIGRGSAARSTRSAVQAGTLAKCKATRGGTPHCPLHFGNLGWRNLSSGLDGKDLLFVNVPLGYGRSATTTLWMAFDMPQSLVRQRFLKSARGRASVTITRYRW